MVGAPDDVWLKRFSDTLPGKSRKRETIAINRLKAAFDKVAPVYDDVADGTTVAAIEDEWLAAHFQASHHPLGKIIDLACGTGWLLDHVTIDSENYIGVDISEGMIERAKAKHPGYRFMVADMHRTFLRPADTIFMGFDTINLSPTVSLMPQAIARQLVPFGLAYIVFVSPAHADHECACHEYTPADLRHWYTPDEAVDLFRERFIDLTVTKMPAPPEHEDAYFVLQGRRRPSQDPTSGYSKR